MSDHTPQHEHVASEFPLDSTSRTGETAVPTPADVSSRFSDLADGEFRSLDPAYVKVDAISWWITTAIIGGGSLIFLIILGIANWPPDLVFVPLSVAWLIVTGLLVWGSIAWPALAYRHTRYAVSPLGLEIHRGVIWRAKIAVPKSRVQHTDVTQGPIMRRYGLATLTVHTAGMVSASVSLEGVRYETAMQIRDYLIHGSGADAV